MEEYKRGQSKEKTPGTLAGKSAGKLAGKVAGKVAGKYAPHGWAGMGLVVIFWAINWGMDGLRTHWAFFPMWLGYCLVIDAIVLYRTGTSLLTRSWKKYAGLFLASAPFWWMFEVINERMQNWKYDGAEFFSPLAYAFWATLSFTTVIPAVFGAAELFASFEWVKRLRSGPVVPPTRPVTLLFFLTGLLMFASMLAWPNLFFPFIWISLYFIFEPTNIWLGHRSLAYWTQKGDWRPVIALWGGVLLTAFFWEMWNYFSYPKWVYQIPWGQWLHIFEMPLLGYGGYLPFALELFAFYHFLSGLLEKKRSRYIRVSAEEPGSGT